MTFEEVVESVECYIEEQHTYFVLENLDTLRKNGRLTRIKSLVAGGGEYQTDVRIYFTEGSLSGRKKREA